MQHYLFSVTKEDKAPAGGGDAVSWLRYYKLDADEAVYIPMPEGLENISAGDSLWLALDHQLYGVAEVERVEEDMMNDRKEIWFNPQLIRRTKETETHLKTSMVGEEIVKRWLEAATT